MVAGAVGCSEEVPDLGLGSLARSDVLVSVAETIGPAAIAEVFAIAGSPRKRKLH